MTKIAKKQKDRKSKRPSFCAKERRLLAMSFSFAMAFVLGFLISAHVSRTTAVDLGQFDPGNIISDAVMGNYKTMTVEQIQNFMKSKNSCDMKGEPDKWHHMKDGHYVCLADETFDGKSAAQIIYEAAEENKINPQVLIVLLEKEQSLITDKWPSSIQLGHATGYGCPDTAKCDTKYYGFENQVHRSAELFRAVLDGGWSNYPVGTNRIAYHPVYWNESTKKYEDRCGSFEVNIKNRATSALYRYTPYQPNDAVLSGKPDGCSAYGNLNFYTIFNKWFGSTQVSEEMPGEKIVAEGIYGIAARQDKTKIIEVANYSKSDSGNIQLNTLNGAVNQRFKLTFKDGYYRIANVNSNKLVDVVAAGKANGTNVAQYTGNGTCAQDWYIVKNSDGTYSFISRCSGKYLDLTGGSTKDGTNVQIYEGNNSSAQKFYLLSESELKQVEQKIAAEKKAAEEKAAAEKKVAEEKAAAIRRAAEAKAAAEAAEKQKQVLAPGDYVIESGVGNDMVLDIKGASRADSANLQIYQKNGTNAQTFTLSYLGNGYYKITNKASGKVIDVFGVGKANSTNVQQYTWNSSCAQRWRITKNSDSTFSLFSDCSGLALDVFGAQNVSGTNVQIYSSNGTKAQKFKFVSLASNNINKAPVPNTQPSSQVISNGTYVFRSAINSNKVIDVFGAGIADGTNVQVYDYNGTGAQKFTVSSVVDNYFKIINTNSGKALTVSGGGTVSGSNIDIETWNGGCSQLFRASKNSDNTYTIFNRCSNKPIDISGANTANGTNIQIYDSNGTKAQKFILSAV